MDLKEIVYIILILYILFLWLRIASIFLNVRMWVCEFVSCRGGMTWIPILVLTFLHSHILTLRIPTSLLAILQHDLSVKNILLDFSGSHSIAMCHFLQDEKSWKIFVFLFGGMNYSSYLCRRFSGARQFESKLSLRSLAKSLHHHLRLAEQTHRGPATGFSYDRGEG